MVSSISFFVSRDEPPVNVTVRSVISTSILIEVQV